jgi:hypothetical protein
VLLRHQLAHNFFGWLSYTLSRAERRDGSDEDWRLFKWDQTHILSLVASYELPDGWTVGARFRLVSGYPDTLRLGSVYDADNDDFIRIAGPPLGYRVPPFHALDLRIDKRFVFDNALLDIYVDVENVYDRANPEDLDYSYDSTMYGFDVGLPLIPSLGIRVEL